MKNLLLVSPYFPPSSLPPVHRTRHMVRHIEEFGWRPIVLAVDPKYTEGKMDWELLNLLPENAEIIRTKAFPYKVTKKLGFTNVGFRALPHLYLAARRICLERQIDAVFLIPPPWTWVLGPALKREFGIPYILDYQDPWVTNFGRYSHVYEKAFWAHRISRVLEPGIIRNASHIVGVSQLTYEFVRSRYPDLPDGKYTQAPFGGESKDFEYLDSVEDSNPYLSRSDSVVNFVYVGALGHAMRPVLYPLMKAIRKIKRENPNLYRRIRFNFIGSTYAAEVKPEHLMATILASEIGIGDVVTEHPERIGYLDALRVMRTADVNLILSISPGIHYTPSKVYPCVLAKRPILAVLNEASVAVRFMREVGAGRIVTFSDSHPLEDCVDEIAAEITEMAQGNVDEHQPSIDRERLEEGSARKMAQVLAQTLDIAREDFKNC